MKNISCLYSSSSVYLRLRDLSLEWQEGVKEEHWLRPVDFNYSYREESNKIKKEKWHHLVWLDQILAAVLLGRFILLCMAPHLTCISSLPQSVGVPRHRITVYCSWHSSRATNGVSLVQPYRGTAVKSLSLHIQQPSLSSGCRSGIEGTYLLTLLAPDTLYLPVPQPVLWEWAFLSVRYSCVTQARPNIVS